MDAIASVESIYFESDKRIFSHHVLKLPYTSIHNAADVSSCYNPAGFQLGVTVTHQAVRIPEIAMIYHERVDSCEDRVCKNGTCTMGEVMRLLDSLPAQISSMIQTQFPKR